MPAQFLAAVLVITRLVTLKSALMSADYRGDVAGLQKLRAQADAMSNDSELGYLADYWSGFASWRIVVNGMNDKMKPAEAQAELARAAAAFESSIQKKADFADSYAADAAVHGWMAAFKMADAPAMNAEIAIYKKQINRALELEPNNSRVLWIQAVPFAVLPPERGGDLTRAIELYRSMIKNATPLNADSPLPDWGKVEALMSLANVHLKQVPPNIDAASAEVKQILALEPDWHYVRDILALQVEAKQKPLHDFDYLLGDWEFTGTNARSGHVHGVWSAARLGDGEILDEIRIAGDNGAEYRTQYLRIYNFRDKRWEIVATEKGAGLQNRGTAVREGDEVRLEQTIGAASGKPSLLRIRYFNIGQDRFSWTADLSNDQGKTWVNGFQQLEVRRIGPERPLGLTSTNNLQH